MIRLPGEGHQGVLPKIAAKEFELADSLKAIVDKLAMEIGERNIRNLKELDLAADWPQEELSKLNYTVERQTYDVAKRQYHNLIVEQKGKANPHEIVVVCTRYKVECT